MAPLRFTAAAAAVLVLLAAALPASRAVDNSVTQWLQEAQKTVRANNISSELGAR